MSKFAITMAQYNRVHQVIHGVIKEEACVERSCTFFAIVGSYLLNKHYGVAARPVAGGFALCVDDEPKYISYGKNEDGKFAWGNDAFHMWVQTQEHVIDFMAPIYAESFAVTKPDIVIPRKMFQKLLADDSQNLNELTSVGDYIIFPDLELSQELIDRFLGRPVNVDLLHVAEEWFGRVQSPQRPTISMGGNDGIVRHLTLPKAVARGPW